MVPVYTLSGCSLEHFLSEAKEHGWAVLGTVGSETLKERERGERRRKQEVEGEVEKAIDKMLPVFDCHQYCAKGPTIVVVGKGLLTIIITPRTCARGKAIGFVYRLSSARKSPHLEI